MSHKHGNLKKQDKRRETIQIKPFLETQWGTQEHVKLGI
jgi:hypothetical protein